MAKILVTGGAGFIGSNLVDRLINEGYEVVVIDNLSTGKKEYLNEKAKFYEADICNEGMDIWTIEEIFNQEKPDYVFHLAAHASVRKSVEVPAFDCKINVLGSLNVFKNSLKHNVKKVVFISTGGGLYGDVSGPAGEDTPPLAFSPYAIHKYTAERYLDFYKKINGLDYVILRPANVYGPRQYKGGEGAAIAVFTHNIINNKEVDLYGDGLQTRDFVYVADAVDACLAAMTSDYCGMVNIGTGKEISILDLIKIIEKVAGKNLKVINRPAVAGEVRRSVLKIDKAKETLGWEPKVTLEEGIRKTIEWLKS